MRRLLETNFCLRAGQLQAETGLVTGRYGMRYQNLLYNITIIQYWHVIKKKSQTLHDIPPLYDERNIFQMFQGQVTKTWDSIGYSLWNAKNGWILPNNNPKPLISQTNVYENLKRNP